MFSGLIKSIGTLIAKSNSSITVQLPPMKVNLGDSICISGVCLTVTKIKKGNSFSLSFDLSPETIKKTTLIYLKVGSEVNVEPALKISDSLGGHIVQGHIDGMGSISRIKKQNEMKTIFFNAPKSIMRYIVPKGSVTVDGVSLTSVNVSEDNFSVALIPHTLQHTTLGNLKTGQRVNLEADVIAKYISKYLKK